MRFKSARPRTTTPRVSASSLGVRTRIAFAFLVAITLSACAMSTPAFSGARTTPRDRADVIVGAAVRTPVSDLARSNAERSAEDRNLLTLLGREGVTPTGSFRYGVSEYVDVGATVSATTLALTARRSFVLDEDTRIIVGLQPRGGWLSGDDAHGYLFGANVPLVLGRNFGGVYEFWAGISVGIDRAAGRVGGTNDVSSTGFRTGAVVGLSVGLRTIAALVELAADYEWWNGKQGSTSAAMNGLVLTPAFALRIRL